jgi:hypothetical protein
MTAQERSTAASARAITAAVTVDDLACRSASMPITRARDA